MAPPRDRLGALQANTYFDPEDQDEAIFLNIEEDNEGTINEIFYDIEELRELVNNIEAIIENVRRTQNQIISSPSVDPGLKQSLEDYMNDIKKKANQARTKLKVMELSIEESEKLKSSTAETRIKKTQHMVISRKFVEIMTNYNKIQLDFRENSKDKLKRQMELAGTTLNEDDLDEMLEAGSGAQLLGHIHIEGNEEQLRATISDIENRHQLFMSLEKSIQGLHGMFNDMAMLIESQGELVNRIDNHVESAVEYTTRATNDTKKALEYQSKARRKKIMMMICMIIAGSLGTYIIGKYLNFWG